MDCTFDKSESPETSPGNGEGHFKGTHWGQLFTKYRYNIVNTNTMKQRQTTIYFCRRLFYLSACLVSLIRRGSRRLRALHVTSWQIVTGVFRSTKFHPPTWLWLSLVWTSQATQSSSFVLLARNNGSSLLLKCKSGQYELFSTKSWRFCRVLVPVARVALIQLLSHNKLKSV